jgi:predicted RNA binding protein YcfA (HicA-like mRNA interferase family)
MLRCMARGVRGWTAREIEAVVLADGWRRQYSRSGHRQYAHPTKPGLVTIPWHRGTVLKPKTAASIFRQARISLPE